MKIFYCIVRINKSGVKKYLTRKGKFKAKQDLTLKSLKKQNIIAIRGFIEEATGGELHIEEF